MAVLLIHAPADEHEAEACLRALERRGLFVAHDTDAWRGGKAGRVAVALGSKSLWADPSLVARVLQAWEEGPLRLAALDATPAPMGLRDIPHLTVSDGRRPDDWREAARELLDLERATPSAPVSAPEGAFTRHGGDRARLAQWLLIAAAFAAAATMTLWAAPGAKGAAQAALWTGVTLALAALLLSLTETGQARPRGQRHAVIVAHAAKDRSAALRLCADLGAGLAVSARAAPPSGPSREVLDCAIDAADVLVAITAQASESDGLVRLTGLFRAAGRRVRAIVLGAVDPPAAFGFEQDEIIRLAGLSAAARRAALRDRCAL